MVTALPHASVRAFTLCVLGIVVTVPFSELSPALADCQPNPPATGSTVTCSGPAPTTLPIDAAATTDVTVNINSDANLVGEGILISLGARAEVTNNGTIEVNSTGSGTAAGVIAWGPDSVLRNFGSISASGLNALTMVSAGNNNSLTNEAGAEIEISGDLSAGLLVSGASNNTLINAGHITLNTFQGGGLFSQGGDANALTNTATGVIESNLDLAFGMHAFLGNGHQLLNEGTITTHGEASHGILLNETTNSIATNAGSITTSGGSSELLNRAYGMFATLGQGNTLLNAESGVINASGLGSSGIELLDSSGNLLRNEGTINITGAGAHGIYVVSGANNTLDNRGTLNVNGVRGNGLRADDGDNDIFNSGTIVVRGADAFGVYMQGTNNTLTNTGTIRATGTNADAVLSNTLGSSFVGIIENSGSIISERRFAIRGVNGREIVTNSGLIRSDAGTAIDLRGGNDTLILQTGSQIVGLADGGTGSDSVVLEGSGIATNDFQNFETLRMTGADWTLSGNGAFDDSQVENGILRIDGTLTSPVAVHSGAVLTGYGTVTGVVSNSGTVAVANAIPASSDDPIGTFTINGTLNNSGHLQLGGEEIGNRLLVVGDYVGLDGATAALNTFLGTDGSPSDQIVIDGGSASGLTDLMITNIGGPGALTTADGIMIVEAINGATTNTFQLNNSLSAGGFEYFLFQGGISDGSDQNWYLRSALVASPPGEPPPVPAPSPSPLDPSSGDPFPLPVPTADPENPPVQPPPPTPGAKPSIGAVIPLYSIEVPVASALPGSVRQSALMTLGTFHERYGDQRIFGSPDANAAWGRIFGGSIERNFGGTVDPTIDDGSYWGIQAGVDVLHRESRNNHRDIAGLFLGYSAFDADVKGFALGWNDLSVGDVSLNAISLGAYWTHIGPSGWYLDAVAMWSHLGGGGHSQRGIEIDADGENLVLSLEGGYPIPLSQNWKVEPQAQLIWQNQWLDDSNDGFSSISFDTDDATTGRLGLRLEGEYDTSIGLMQPYLKADLWHDFSSVDSVRFDGNSFRTAFEGTALELGGGLIATISQNVRVAAMADYTFDVDSRTYRAFKGNVRLDVKW